MNLSYFSLGKIGRAVVRFLFHSHSGNKAVGLSGGRACRGWRKTVTERLPGRDLQSQVGASGPGPATPGSKWLSLASTSHD